MTAHPTHLTDSFGLYVKAATLVSKVKLFNGRYRSRYGSEPIEPRDTVEFKALESLISTFQLSFPKDFRNPYPSDSTRTGKFDVPLYVAHTLPHYAVITLHEVHADFESENCGSVEKLVTAARAILDLVHIVCTSSFSLCLLDPILTFIWFTAARTMTRLMKSKLAQGSIEEAGAIISEIGVIKLALLHMGERLPIGNRQAKMLEDFIAAEMGPAESEWKCMPPGIFTARVDEVAETSTTYQDILSGHDITIADFLPADHDGLRFDQQLADIFGPS